MALKDCIEKLGVISSDDEALLKHYLAEGMTDAQAVRRLLIESSVDVISIADKAREAGATINVPKDTVGEIRSLQDKRLRKLLGERAALEDEMAALNDAYKVMSWESELFDLLLARGKQLYDPVENMSREEVLMRIGQVMFDENVRDNLALGWHGFQGRLPQEVANSWLKHKQRKVRNRRALNKLVPRWNELKSQVNTLIADAGEQTYFQDDKELETIEASVGTDQRRMFELVGPSMYGDMQKMGAVSIKELFQNAFDAARTAVERGQESGNIDVSVSSDNRTVTITDDGIGMTPEIIMEAFLKQAGTRKEGKVNSGGFGLAKMLFLFGSKTLKLNTVRDGVRTTMEVTGDQVMENAGDPETNKIQLQRERTDDPSGTTVEITIADEFLNTKTGKVEPVMDIVYRDIVDVTENQILSPDITVTRQGWTGAPESSGSKFKSEDYFSLGRIKFDWGTADVLVAKERRYQYESNTVVSVEGLKQFEMAVTENPLEFFSALIDRRFIIDVHPSVAPEHPTYPFQFNRQGLKDHAAADLVPIQLMMATRHNADKTMQTSKGYGTLRTIEPDVDPQVEQTDLFGKYLVSENIEIAPDIPEDQKRAGLEAMAGDTVEVVDGKLFINGEEQAEMTAEEFASVRFDVAEARVEQDIIPTKVPLLHNNHRFKNESELKGTVWETSAGKDLIELLYEEFGPDQVNEYFAGVGGAFLKLRDLIAVKGNVDRYGGIDKVGVGVSVLGKGFYGVHTRVPAMMMFVNPGAEVRAAHIAEDVPASERHRIMATSLMTTMIHEIAHYSQFNHSIEYIIALQDAFSTAFGEAKFIDGVVKDLEATLSKGAGIYGFISQALDGGALELTGQDLTDLGTAATTDERGTGDVTGERDTSPAGQRGRIEAGRRDRDTSAELDDERVRQGAREGGIVAPRGAVHPDSGLDAASPQAVEARQAALEQFMFGSHVVDKNGDPLVVYHGTQDVEGFDVFAPQGGFGGWNNMGTWFSSERVHADRLTQAIDQEGQTTEGRVVEAYLSIKNPLETDWDTLQNEITTAIENYNKDNPDATPLSPWGGTGPVTSEVGKFLNQHFKQLGYDGIIIRGWEGDGKPAQDVFVAFDSEQVKASSAEAFDPLSPNIYQQGRRGSITFDAERRATIKLFEAADLSTFIHEAGHLYLELLKRLASRPDASEQILKDSETVLRYLGIDSLEDIETKHHEKWAESFEAYTMEGKAPSIGLQDAFNAFRTWLLDVYRKIAGVRDIELPDDIRSVMDRMLATDEEIALAEANMDYAPLYTSAEQMGVSDEVFEVYKQSIIRAHNDEVAKQSSKLMAAMKRDQLQWWKDETKKEEAKVRAEAEQSLVFKARARLMRNRLPNGKPTGHVALKLDRQSVLDALMGDEETLKALPHTGQYGIYRRKGGTDVDVAAQELGYRDGRELLQDLLTAPDMETWIKATTAARMQEKFPDPFKDASMAGAAVRAVHSTQRAGIISAEMRALRKLMREDRKIVSATKRAAKRERMESRVAGRGQMPKRHEMRMFRRAAAEKIASMRIRDVKPHVFLRAERKAANEAFVAMEQNNLEAAYEAKRRQLINFEMYRAAVKAADEMQKTQRYFAKFESKRVQQRLGKGGVLNQILGVLDGLDLRKRSLAEVDRLEAMKELRDAVDSGQMVVTPETLALIKSDMVNWQNLTVEQFRGIKEIIKQLEHAADRTQYVYLNDEKHVFDDIVTELEASVIDAGTEVDLYGGKPPMGTRAKRLKDQAITAWLRPGSLARILDGAGWGTMTKRFIVPVRRAYAEKYIPQIHAMQDRMAKLYLDHFSLKDLQRLYKPTIVVKGQNKKYTKADAISLALNQGNEGNQRAVLGSLVNEEPIYPQHMIDQLLGTLTESDWRFVQGIWDYLEEFYPAIAAAEERRRGIAPERVEAKPLTVHTADGKTLTLRGGYYPLAYDSTLSDRVKQDEFEDINQKMGLGVYVSASTRAGATFERVKNHGLPVRLDLNVLDMHLRDVIRDVTLGDEVNAIQRVINDKRFRQAMRATNNMEALKQLNLWLTDAAVGESPANHIAVKSARYIRGGFVKAKLGLSATVALLQFTGFFQSMAHIGTATLGRGLAKFATRPTYWWKYVQEESAFIKARYEIGAWNRDVQDVQAHADSFFGAVPTMGKRTFNLIGASLFMPIKYAQKVVDVTTWLAGYEQGRNERQMGHSEAVLYADSVVEAAQTSGFFSDRSPLERGTLSENIRQAEYVRIWTTLIGYMLAKGNLAYEKTKSTNFKKPSKILQWAMDMVLLFTIEGMASAIIYGHWPEDDDETGEKEYGKWVTKATLDSIASGVPFVREIPNQRYGSGSTPIGAFSKDLLEVYDQAVQGEVDEALIKTTIDVLGTAAHLPAAQTNRTLKAIWDEDETTPLEYLTGPRDKE